MRLDGLYRNAPAVDWPRSQPFNDLGFEPSTHAARDSPPPRKARERALPLVNRGARGNTEHSLELGFPNKTIRHLRSPVPKCFTQL